MSGRAAPEAAATVAIVDDHEAVRLGLPHRVVREPRLGWDVDVPGDLEIPVALTERPR